MSRLALDITEHTGVIAATAVASIFLVPNADSTTRAIMGACMGLAFDYVGNQAVRQKYNYNRMTSVGLSGAVGAVGGKYLFDTFSR